MDEFESLVDDSNLAGVGHSVARDYYAIARELRPEVAVETGVCNGVSTMAILAALDKNGTGTLHSIDYPFRADESLEEFRSETFTEYGGAAIPSNKEPGWIIPNGLRTNWTLTIGRSKRKLPQVLCQYDTIDMFVHDSEHSHPCMMFEYEIAHEWLSEDGILLSDDIRWNSAFEKFVEVRSGECGKITHDVGYLRPDGA
jgi:predicted O-methyltransferase YrrM